MDTQRLVRSGGWAAVAAGIAGAVIGLGMLAVPGAVPKEDFSYPFSHEWFAVVQTVLALHHAALAYALWAFWRAGLAGTGRFAAIAAWATIVPTALLAGWELVAISGAGLPYPSDETAWLDAGYGVGSLVSAIAFVLLGIAVIRARVLTGWARWIVLVIGVYVFFPLLPAAFAGFVVGRVVLSGWSLLFTALGIAMLRWTAASAAAGARRSETADALGASR